MNIKEILNKSNFNVDDIVALLSAKGEDRTLLFETAAKIKTQEVGDVVYFRGLIEFSNICLKDCLYCGIRKGNEKVHRYTISDDAILNAAGFAYKEKYGSVVLQSGERTDDAFIEKVDNLLQKIKEQSSGEVGITLSCGEQTSETYQKWFDSGAHRYLLRIETTNEALYKTIHPNNSSHDFYTRTQCLQSLKDIGYQVGTGIMVGLPSQTFNDIAADLLFMQSIDIDMCGMGPYIEHAETPLYNKRDGLLPLEERFDLTLKCIAILRILMKDINIAAATAMQAIDKAGREKALKVGANIIMPNVTPGTFRDDYFLYDNKPCTDENPEDCKQCLEARMKIAGSEIGLGTWGDSKHFAKRRE